MTPGWSLAFVAAVSGCVAAYSILLGVVYGPGPLNFVVVYAAYLALAHLGLVITSVLVPSVLYSQYAAMGLTAAHLQWYFGDVPLTTLAVSLSGLGVGSFALAAMILGGRQRRSARLIPTLSRAGDQRIFYAGVTLLLVCMAYLVTMILLGTLPLFGTYFEFRRGTDHAIGYSLFLVILAAGLTFVLSTGSRRQVIWSLWLFLIPAALLLLTGNRGEVLYPAAAGIAVLNSRGYRFRLRDVALLVIVVFFLIPAIRQIRQVGLRQVALEDVSIALADPFIEMGAQIRPLTETLRWIQSGEDLAYGGTYLLPVSRLIGAVVPVLGRPPIEGNRLDVSGRTPAQGYSVVGEAFFNFGVLGVILIPGLIGLYLARFANRAKSTPMLAFHGAVMATLINNVRNSFIFVPGHLIVVVGILLIAHLFPISSRLKT